MPAPIVAATMQATALSSISNILAQLLDNYRKNLPMTLSLPDFLRFLTVTILTAPPNFHWQAFLERTFPGRKPTAHRDIALAERGAGSGAPAGLLDPISEKETPTDYDDESPYKRLRGADLKRDTEETTLDWRNTLTKWFIDCITLGAVVNTVAFLVLMGLLKGKSFGEMGRAVSHDTIPIIVAGYKIWPIASILSFSLIPVEKRIVFLSGVGLLWGIYMSLVAAAQ